ncbi:uncharacterized protein LOC113283816 [Papaver somniferum]|uniref:uncharacterized protein LOC113283816 n=1 Tax=Papaver somniferum TaxID=3469 RepID=UPI000E6FD6E5|nr:uncharacterized protein LOC113283816 [Papaver somniferum]
MMRIPIMKISMMRIRMIRILMMKILRTKIPMRKKIVNPNLKRLNHFKIGCVVLKNLREFLSGKEKFKLFYFRKGLFNKKLKIRGSFYGLVILSCEEGDSEFSHHVYNPITRDSIKLPVLNDPVILQRHIEDLNFYLVFDPATEKYKVVCIAWNYVIVPRQTVSCMTTQYFFKILTLGTGAGSESWKDIDIPKMGFYIGGGSRYKPVSVNGSLNLLCRSGRKVLCIDVSKESYHTIEYPEGASKTSKLLEIEGSLCILDYTNNSNLLDMDQYRNHLDTESMGKFTLWFLTEVENTKKWLKKYDIDMFHNPCVAGPFKSAPVFVAGILNPTLKIIFCVSTSEYENHRDAEDRYYSYDVELKRLESIYRPGPSNYRQWHFNRLIHI